MDNEVYHCAIMFTTHEVRACSSCTLAIHRPVVLRFDACLSPRQACSGKDEGRARFRPRHAPAQQPVPRAGVTSQECLTCAQ